MTNNQDYGMFDDLADEQNLSIDSQEEGEVNERKDWEFLDSNVVNQHKQKLNLDTDNEFQIEKKQLAHNCTLETIVKKNLNPKEFDIDISEIIQKQPKQYKFELDDFQKAAVLSVEKNISVLVAAHTSAGKTAIAEYVIAKCLQNNQRVIYTSPIKALSNQKYRDLKEEFGQVGLVTGDVTIEENQSCLVMTTEILRNMFFRSNEVAKETAWIIFDEAHYLKDKDRGVIWEETIILAPKNVRYCLLSATAPNASELAKWIMKVKNLDCMNVVYTDFRPVPLEHYIYMSGDNKVLMVKNSQGVIKEQNIQKLSNQSSDEKKPMKGKGNAKDIQNIVKFIMGQKYSPAIIFAFSKKEVEKLAKQISKQKLMENLLSKDEQYRIEQIYHKLLGSLKDEDRQLPQITSLLGILKSGVGLHHGGMLPILKEIVEILFQSGQIKILISTETFSMGINMPAKCVVFSTIRKWDGDQFRQLQGSEFVQMSGRAGRRGKDDKGVVVTMMDQNTEVQKFAKMMRQQSKNDPLISQFSISFNMLLNTLQMEGMEPEDMVSKSFKQFQHEIQSVKNGELFERWLQTLKYLDENYFKQNQIKIPLLISMINIENSIQQIEVKLNEILLQPNIILPFMNIGRLYFVEGHGWVPMLNIQKQKNNIQVDFFVILNPSKKKEIREKVKCNCQKCISLFRYDVLKEPQILSIDINDIRKMSSIVVKIPSNLLALNEKKFLQETLNKIIQDVSHEMPLMNLIEDLPIDNEEVKNQTQILKEKLKNLQEEQTSIQQQYNELSLNRDNYIIFEDNEQIELILIDDNEQNKYFFDNEPFNALFTKMNFNPIYSNQDLQDQEIKSFKLLYKFSQMIKKQLLSHNNQSIQIFNKQINIMKQILRRTDFISKDDVPNQKGKIASLIFGTEELILTEMLFSGHFRTLDSKQLVTILTTFINEEKAKLDGKLQFKEEILEEIYHKLKETVQYFAKVYTEQEYPDFDEETMLQKLNISMFDLIQLWYDGRSFAEIMKASDMYEGSVIRNIKRLYELLKQLVQCSLLMGNKDLKFNFEQGMQKIFRGLAFSASLYIEDN